MNNIPIYQPYLAGNEKKYVLDCLETNWISSRGKYVKQFEDAFSEYVGNVTSTTCTNGTVALHLALLALDIGEGDEVIVPSFTYVASVNAIKYVGATPVFVDCNESSWNVALANIANVVTSKTKGIMCVHIYGVPCDIVPIVEFAKNNNIRVIEDCAEALGSKVGGVHVGSFGDISTFSFFGNKTITTGEGGMVSSCHSELIERIAHLKSQAVSPITPYWHDCLGYNYRMTNIAAAIGVAQLEILDQILSRKQAIADRYRENLIPLGIEFQTMSIEDVSSNWLNVMLMRTAEDYTSVKNTLGAQNVDIRPAFPLVSKMPHYVDLLAGEFPIGDRIGSLGLCLPSYPGLKLDQVQGICDLIASSISK
jgi:perosamine synthetase